MEKSGVSLEKKVKRIAVCAGAVVFFSIGANLAVSWFGLGSFGSILEQNAGSLAFWSAMEEERLAFARYVGTALPEERERFEQSRMETRRRLEELPVDYRETASISVSTWQRSNSPFAYREAPRRENRRGASAVISPAAAAAGGTGGVSDPPALRVFSPTLRKKLENFFFFVRLHKNLPPCLAVTLNL